VKGPNSARGLGENAEKSEETLVPTVLKCYIVLLFLRKESL
jgi:hypothetical protein